MHIHTEIINQCCKAVNAQSYLEIGINDRTKNFDLINCRFKIGVDPNPAAVANFTGTSDEFFEALFLFEREIPSISFDVVFLDGLHHYEQLKKDFENALACLKENGLIIIHDTNPAEERFTHVPRDIRGRWNGDCWKLISEIYQYPVEWVTCDWEANGVTVVKVPTTHIPVSLGIRGERNWQYFIENKKSFLNLVNRQKFDQWLM